MFESHKSKRKLPEFIRARLYKDLETLGEGGSGEVFKTKKLGQGIIARKVIYLTSPPKSTRKNYTTFGLRELEEAKAKTKLERFQTLDRIKNEVKLWEKISRRNSPFVLKLLDSRRMNDEYWYEMPVMETEYRGHPVTNLEEFSKTFVKEHGMPLPMAIIKELYAGVFLGLREIHSSGIVHRDVKPSNILLDCSFVPKVCDFDLCHEIEMNDREGDRSSVDRSIYFDPDQPFAGGTIEFSPPEAWLPTPFNVTWDSYSLCLSMLETRLNESPWIHGKEKGSDVHVGLIYYDTYSVIVEDKASPEQAEKYYLKHSCVVESKESDSLPWTTERLEFSEFAKEMMCYDIWDRLTISDACAHPFMRSVVDRWEASFEEEGAKLKSMIADFAKLKKSKVDYF